MLSNWGSQILCPMGIWIQVSMPRRAGTTFLPHEGGSRKYCRARFQCPEGLVPFSNAKLQPQFGALLLGFNAPKGWYLFLTLYGLGRTRVWRSLFQCPEGLVPFSNKLGKYVVSVSHGDRFNAPKGWYLFLTTKMENENIKKIVVSMPRRAGTFF